MSTDDTAKMLAELLSEGGVNYAQLSDEYSVGVVSTGVAVWFAREIGPDLGSQTKTAIISYMRDTAVR